MRISINSLPRARTNVLVLLLFILLSLAMTYPLVLNFRTHIPGVPGDNFAYLWKIWWFEKAMVDLHQNPLFAPHILYPEGFDFARDEATISNTLFSVPLTLWFGHITSYNLMLLLTYILAGFGMYLLVYYLTKSTIAGIVSGVIFAFSPYHQMRGLQHLNLATIQWIPFLFLYVEKFLRELRLKHAFLAGIFYALTALAAWYYAYYVAVTLAIYLLIRARPLGAFWMNKNFLKGVLVFFAVSFILVAPFAISSFKLHSTGVMKYKFIDVDTYSASLEDFFVPASFHSFWGNFFHQTFGSLKLDWSEHMLYLGIVPVLLALFAIKRRRKENAVSASAWLALITFIFALGTTFHIFGERVLIRIPRFLKSFTIRKAFPIPLPMLLFFFALPFISSTRVWSRFGLMTMFFVALLAGWGTAEFSDIIQKRFNFRNTNLILGVSLVFLVLLDFTAVPLPMSKIEPRPVDIWLGKIKEQFTIIQLPDATQGPQLLYTIYHNKRIANGCGAFLPPQFNIDLYGLKSLPDKNSIRILRKMGIRYLLLNREKYGEKWKELSAKLEMSKSLKKVGVFGEIVVFAVLGSAEPPQSDKERI